jgi:glutamate dehydrogenase
MERAGVVIFKDASANKGGVTSSSLEVLAALSLSDEEFIKHMMLKESDFYDRYVCQVQKTIENNASLEFECLWKEHERTGRPRPSLSDALSLAIVKMNNELTGPGGDALFAELGERVLERFVVPPLLLELIGGIKIFRSRVPANYQRAMFAAWVASRFVYEFGIDPPQFAFFTFMSKIR